MTRPAPAMDKALLRASLRTARAAMDPADRQLQSRAAGRAVVEHVTRSSAGGSAEEGQPTVAAYLGVGPEPDTAPLLEELHRRGVAVVVPVCEPDHQLSWTTWVPGVALQRSVRAPVDEPVGARRPFAELARVALILVPALGVDASGNRVGQGGGYYDRFLAQHPRHQPGAVPRLGMVYRSELLPPGVLPAEPFDQPLDGVFTADGLLRTDGHGRPE